MPIKVYSVNTEFLNNDAAYHEALNSLPIERQRKAQSFMRRSDRNLSIGAGILISRGLSELGLDEKQMHCQRTESGKPYFAGYPDIHFNVSHSGNMALAVFGSAPVGCDIEKIDVPDLNIAQKFFCAEEYEYIITAADKPEQAKRFFRLWTLKESYVKATGHGLSQPLNSFCISITGDTITLKDCRSRFSFKELHIADGYCAAYCMQSDKARMIVTNI